MTTLKKWAVLALVGGIIYGLIEFLARGYTHWTMVVLGGICFVAVGLLNEVIPWEMPLVVQMLCGCIIITTLEFVTGYIVNIRLGWAVWDYSDRWGNLLGQICPLYSFYWFLLSAVAIVLDDWMRHKWFGERKPKYKLF